MCEHLCTVVLQWRPTGTSLSNTAKQLAHETMMQTLETHAELWRVSYVEWGVIVQSRERGPVTSQEGELLCCGFTY